MRVIRYETPKQEVTDLYGTTIFLAGPTVRGNQPHLTSWRFKAVEIFEELGFTGNLILPEFSSKVESDKGKKCVPLWELNGLQKAHCILFWVPRTRDIDPLTGLSGLIALTTNWELGYWMGRNMEKVIYGRPDDAFRISYLDTMWEAIEPYNQQFNSGKAPVFNTLEDTIKASIERAERIAYFQKTLD